MDLEKAVSALAIIFVLCVIVYFGIQISHIQSAEVARWVAEHPNETLEIWN